MSKWDSLEFLQHSLASK